MRRTLESATILSVMAEPVSQQSPFPADIAAARSDAARARPSLISRVPRGGVSDPDEVLDLFIPSDVASYGKDFAGQGGELPGGGFKVFQFTARDDDVRTGFREPASDGLANAAPAAGDQGDLAVEAENRSHEVGA